MYTWQKLFNLEFGNRYLWFLESIDYAVRGLLQSLQKESAIAEFLCFLSFFQMHSLSFHNFFNVPPEEFLRVGYNFSFFPIFFSSEIYCHFLVHFNHFGLKQQNISLINLVREIEIFFYWKYVNIVYILIVHNIFRFAMSEDLRIFHCACAYSESNILCLCSETFGLFPSFKLVHKFL